MRHIISHCRFSLRAIALLTFVAGVGTTVGLSILRDQATAVRELERRDCEVYYISSNEPPTMIERLRFWCGDAKPRHVCGVDFQFQFSRDTDIGTVYLTRLPHIVTLDFSGRGVVTDADLCHFRGLSELSRLELDGTSVTDAGLAYLAKLKNIEVLDLRGTRVTDAGLVHLIMLTHLIELDLGMTRVTRNGVIRLKQLPRLQLLALSRATFTDRGAQELENCLPQCHIEWLSD